MNRYCVHDQLKECCPMCELEQLCKTKDDIIRLYQLIESRLKQRIAEAEAKNTELEKELFILASDVIYFENQTMPYEIVRKAKRIYEGICGSEGE